MAGGALAGAQKRAEAEGRTIIWVDESGFYLLPVAVRTWAPRGQPPIVRVTLTHDHLAAISAISEPTTNVEPPLLSANSEIVTRTPLKAV